MKKSPINEFVGGYTKPHTIFAYKRSLKLFFEAINKDPVGYFSAKNDYDVDMKTYINYIQSRAPITKKHDISTVRTFLDENGVNIKEELSKKTQKLIKLYTKKIKAITQDIVCTPKELKKILQYGTLKDRALFLFLSSTGLRIDEALKLTFDDIRFDKNPVLVDVSAPITKTSESRITFMSNEAKDCLLEWKKHRPEYLHQACTKSIKKKWKEDPHIFPFAYPTAHRMWNRLLEQSGFAERDKTTGRHRRHIHTLRKYFRIYLAPKATSDVTELLLGHQDALGNVYRDKYPESKLGEMYKRAVPDISVFEVAPDLSEVNEKLDKKDKTIEDMQMQINDLQGKYGDLLHELFLQKK